ncbi:MULTISPECIES: DUF669 domain-containing protein [Enterococcus]|uniref:DUF669 domain-containing protein n=1 Tax=Enterococcus TaxID=1350 RepID=UPI000ED7859B|nr:MULTISPECIES: DUF669 domain-containing protein [Enterococcus]MDN6003580.1 DUF669 domain-containing protein [Enterococcus sp.]MDN6562337.1 DUF669 domain-containing protein [Enterococcus sp.]MDN6778105.1 DUF669 domain-containing protein [Enterococcus sp.]HCM85549.1 hypothetical protein [Enterococcus sp.]
MTLFVVDSQNVFGKSVGEAGSYNVKILSDSEYKKTQQTQEDMAVLNYEVIDGKYTGGKVLYDNLVWKNDNVEMSVKRFNTVLAAIGVPDGTEIESVQQLVQALKGKQLNITVDWEQSDFNGRWNLKVKGYHKIDQEGSKPNGIERPTDHPETPRTNNNTFQESLPGTDPFADAKSIANGGINISDDDLPF